MGLAENRAKSSAHANYMKERGIRRRRHERGRNAQCGPDGLRGFAPRDLVAIECLHVDLHLPSLSNRTALSHLPLVQGSRK